MPTTFVQGLPRLQGRLDYVLYGSGPEGTARRNARETRALASWCSFATPEQMGAYARKVRERFGNRRYEGYDLRVSWPRDELDPGRPEDVLRAMEFGHALVRELFPESPFAITAHGDGVGSCLHLHIEVVNVRDMRSCRAIRGLGRANWQVRAVTDVLSRQRGMRVVSPMAHEGAWAERAAELEAAIDSGLERVGGGKWTRAMRDAKVALAVGRIVDETITAAARDMHSVDDFEHELGRRGVGIVRRQTPDGGEGWTYTVECELEGKSRRRRVKASKVLREYTPAHVMGTIRAEAERQRQAEERSRMEAELLMRLAEDARMRQAAADAVAVTGGTLGDATVTVNAALFGGAGSPWGLNVPEGMVETYARFALEELPREADGRLRNELASWAGGGTSDVPCRRPARQLAERLAEAMRDGACGGWEVPTEKWSGLAEGFRMAMRQSSRDGSVGAVHVLAAIMSVVCDEIDTAGMTIRDTVRAGMRLAGVPARERPRGAVHGTCAICKSEIVSNTPERPQDAISADI